MVRTTNARSSKRSAPKPPPSVTPTPPAMLAPDSDEDDDYSDDDDATTTRRNTTSNFKIRTTSTGHNNNTNKGSGGSKGGNGVPSLLVATLVFFVVLVGVVLQAREVSKIARSMREEGEKKLALDPVKREVQRLRESAERETKENRNTFCTKEEMEKKVKELMVLVKESSDRNSGGSLSSSKTSSSTLDDRATKAELARLTKEMEAVKKIVNEDKPWDQAMQKTIDAWYETSSVGGGGGDGAGKKKKGWFGGGKGKVPSSPPWTVKDEEIEKATEQLRADMEDVKLKLAKKGLSTQTAMQRMTHALADKTGLVDYASVHGGGRVLKHSTLSPLVARENGPITAMLMYFRGKAAPHPKSNEWLLKQTLEPPGDCLALRGTKGYVDVQLKEKITVSGFTLEHVNPLIAYDRSSAPKEVKLGAWGMFPKVKKSSASDDSNDNDVKKMSWRYEEFGNFTFDPTVADGVTTFTFSEDKIVGTTDRVRFSVDSNHGNAKWTCVYRLRVHGSNK
jgi:hypothetical protein